MDYREWGREYLQEAAMLKRHLTPLRKELERVSGQDAILLYRRVSMLNEMYLECLHTGRELVGKGENLKRGPDLSLELFGDRLPIPARADDGGEHRRMLRILREAEQGELTERQRECVRLHYGEGKSVGEIAKCLGITAPTVSKHLKKARARLAKVLGYYFPRVRR